MALELLSLLTMVEIMAKKQRCTSHMNLVKIITNSVKKFNTKIQLNALLEILTNSIQSKTNIMKLLRQFSVLCIVISLTNCVQKTHPKTITVKVDMNAEENHSEVGIRGNTLLSWKETTYLSDENNDGIYEGTFEINTANQDIEFKFVNHNDAFELQDQNNRSLSFEYQPETIVYEATFNSPKATIKRH